MLDLLSTLFSGILSFPSLLLLYAGGSSSSWSTYLNILFFQFTWSTLVLSNSPLRIELLSCAAVRALFYWVPSLLITGVDWGIGLGSSRREGNPAEGLKIGPGRTGALPEGPDVDLSLPEMRAPAFLAGSRSGSNTTSGRGRRPGAGFTRGLRRMFSGSPSLSLSPRAPSSSAPPSRTQQATLSLINMIVSLFLQGAIEYTLVHILHRRSALKISTTLPIFSLGGVLFDIIKLSLLRELTQYTLHRFLLHNYSPRPNSTRGVTNYLSNLHKRTYHTPTLPTPFSAHYDHPLSYIFLRFLPSYLPSLLLRPHLLTHLLFLSLTSLEESLSHSAYTNPPSLPLIPFIPAITLLPTSKMCKRVDAHITSSRKGDDGGFGAWGLMDWVCGTAVRGGEEWGEDMGRNVERGARGVKEGVKGRAKGRRDSGFAEGRGSVKTD